MLKKAYFAAIVFDLASGRIISDGFFWVVPSKCGGFMKKLLFFALLGMSVSMVVAADRDELVRQIMALGGKRPAWNAGIPALQAKLAALRALNAPVVRPPAPDRMGDVRRDHDDVEEGDETIGCCGIVWRVLSGCGDCIRATARCAVRHPVATPVAATICCAGCGLYLGSVAGAMTAGLPQTGCLSAAASCCKITGTCCSLVAAKKVYNWCASCVEKGIARVAADGHDD